MKGPLKLLVRAHHWVCALAFCAAFTSHGGAVPGNDNFADRVLLAGTNVTAQGDNTGATMEPGENTDSSGVEMRASVWYSWTAPAKGVCFLSGSTTNLEFFLRLGVYRGAAVGSLVTASARWDGAYPVNSGDTIQVRVVSAYDTQVGIGGGTGPFSLDLHFYPSPANDNFANRTPLTGTNIWIEADNIGASTEAGETGDIHASVWYAWTAQTFGVVYFSGGSTNSNFSFSLGTYLGTSLGSLSIPPTTTQDGGFFVSPGTTIQLQVASAYDPYWGTGGGIGYFTLHIVMRPRAPPSPNDAFANRIDITVPTFHFEGSIFGATNEPGEPLPSPDQRQTLWWRLVPSEDGLLKATLTTPYPSALVVYEGAAFASMVPAPAAGATRFRVLAGHEYSVQAVSAPVPSGGFTLDTLFQSTSNDMFATSERVTGTNWSSLGNYTFATREANEPQPSWPNTVWISWVAPATGRAWVYSVNGYIVYTGASLETLQEVAVPGIVSGVRTFMAVEGTEYRFQFGGVGDDFEVSLRLEPFVRAPNDDFQNAQEYRGEVVYGDAKSFVGATMETGEPLHMGETPQKSLWWKWQAPRRGFMSMSFPNGFLTNNAVIAAYQGTAVDALTLVGKGTNSISMPTVAGDTYHIAVALPADSVGDLLPLFGLSRATSIAQPVTGNLLGNGSFEGAEPGGQDWSMTGGFGGHHNERGGADGLHWPVVPTGGKLWQDIATIPGHDYAIRFAYRIGGCCGIGGVRTLWDEKLLGTAYSPEGEGFWHWSEYIATASNNVTRVTWTNIHVSLEMDAFSVVDLNAPPHITRQPQSLTTLEGGNAVFMVESLGTRPLYYQWYHDGASIAGANKPLYSARPVDSLAAGGYTVVITNQFGVVTSLVATLKVEAPTNATIIVQPYGDTVPAGGYYNFAVVAAGLPELRYQWFLDGAPVSGATNRTHTLTSVQASDGGKYEVLVQNDFSAVMSLSAPLVVTNPITGGGVIDFRNRPSGPGTVDAAIYDVDGLTLLSGNAFVAQLYAGSTVEGLRGANVPVAFRTNTGAGYFFNQIVTLPNVAPGTVVFAQVRAWEREYGASYEEARARGGKFGKSKILQVQAGGGLLVPGSLSGLENFRLQAGLPVFTVGSIRLVDHDPDGTVVWALDGEPGFQYLIEKSVRPSDPVWRPYVTLTNLTGTVTFSDSANSNGQLVLYRSRILD